MASFFSRAVRSVAPRLSSTTSLMGLGTTAALLHSTSLTAEPRATTTSRVTLPDDANPAGNVHGGTILKEIDHAAFIASMRMANSENKVSDATSKPTYTALARLDKMDFLAPMHVGEVAHLEASVTYCSTHSCEVQVDVFAENLGNGVRRHTNRARLWYIATDGELVEGAGGGGKRFKTVPMPSMSSIEPEQEAAGRERYGRQLASRKRRALVEEEGTAAPWVTDNTTELVQLMLPSDVNSAGVAGGSILKLMDNAAGVCAARHCRTNIVTATLDALDFRMPIFKGNVVRVRARPTFASSRSLEVEVEVLAENALGESASAVRGFLTFVSLDADGRPLPLPPLPPPVGDKAIAAREAGRLRYEARKAARQARKKNQQQRE